jgi:hypothetical protein
VRRRILVPAVVIAAAAITSAVGTTGCLYLVDLSGLSGEAAPAPADGATADAPLDGALDANDASATSDAPTEAAPKSPCAAPHAFCSDFDDGPLGQGWSRSSIDAPATLALDALALSPTRSLRATYPRKTAAMTGYAVEIRTLATTWKRAVFQGDVLIQPPAWQQTDANVAIVELFFNSASNATGTYLFISETNTTATIEHLPDGPDRYLNGDPMPYGRWAHVLVDFDPGGRVHYEVDGKGYDKTFAGVTAGAMAKAELGVGLLNFNDPVPAFDVRWDNVLVDFP